MVNAADLNYDTRATAEEMAETIFGEGITVVSASYSGDRDSSAIYSGGDTIAPGVTPSDTGVILSTGDADDFTNRARGNDPANQDTNTSTNTSGVNNDPDFNELAGASTFDAAILDVDFIPEGDVMTLQFVFASEEYPEFTNSVFNDAVGIWINGELVPVEIAGETTSIGNVNDVDNQNLYIDNSNSDFNTEMDGFTVTMTVTIPVVPGEVNSIRIGIADVADSNFDSSVLIAAGSGQSAFIAISDDVNVAPGESATVDVLANDISRVPGVVTITHINGVPVVAGDTVTLATGQQITLNPDGTFTVVADSDTETVSFTYTAENSVGLSDTGFVTVNSVPCFVAGTRILTDRGEVAIETLQEGDLVHTLDNGLQPVRWIGRRTVAAEGTMAPILIKAGALGNDRDIKLSPHHRVLIGDNLAELLFGEGEVLVAAKDLVNDHSIRPQIGGTVEYVHILFDAHQIVFTEGLETESFLPGPQTTRSFERQTVAEICRIFPELDPATGMGYGPAARRTLKAYEARVLFGTLAA